MLLTCSLLLAMSLTAVIISGDGACKHAMDVAGTLLSPPASDAEAVVQVEHRGEDGAYGRGMSTQMKFGAGRKSPLSNRSLSDQESARGH